VYACQNNVKVADHPVSVQIVVGMRVAVGIKLINPIENHCPKTYLPLV